MKGAEPLLHLHKSEYMHAFGQDALGRAERWFGIVRIVRHMPLSPPDAARIGVRSGNVLATSIILAPLGAIAFTYFQVFGEAAPGTTG
ncbi:MAG: hypothetical protein ABSH20_00860 [Tepidisphaeraceae bacterium]